jgi:hypothetical protein
MINNQPEPDIPFPDIPDNPDEPDDKNRLTGMKYCFFHF